MDKNAVKIFVILFTLTFVIDQYLIGRDEIFFSLFVAAIAGVILSGVYLFLKKGSGSEPQ